MKRSRFSEAQIIEMLKEQEVSQCRQSNGGVWING